ncbi:MAG: hypothetical protein AMXMBFR83_26400 [Phycisphaerae bacterium]
MKHLARAAAIGLALACCGCPGVGGDSTTDGNVGVSSVEQPGLRVKGEPNDDFTQPVDVVFDASDTAHLSGSISTADDIDVYALGPLSAGDRLVIDVEAVSGNLDAAIALFDEAGRLAFENDDRNYSLGQLDPFLNAVIRRDSSVYFLAISAAPLANSRSKTGRYRIGIQLVRGGQVPPTAGQIVMLDFGGGTIEIPGDATYTVGPFDAGDIDPSYAGLTAAVRQQVRATVVENFEGLALDVRVFPGDSFPPAGTYSRVLFGGRNPSALGISQDIDAYNSNQADGSIIFTEMFTPDRFRRVLSAAELGTAIGNVATHEIGHLLGLNHVSNVSDLMDTTGGANTLLFDQEFMSSPLHGTIFGIGSQDGFLLLLETLGAS